MEMHCRSVSSPKALHQRAHRGHTAHKLCAEPGLKLRRAVEVARPIAGPCLPATAQPGLQSLALCAPCCKAAAGGIRLGLSMYACRGRVRVGLARWYSFRLAKHLTSCGEVPVEQGLRGMR